MQRTNKGYLRARSLQKQSLTFLLNFPSHLRYKSWHFCRCPPPDALTASCFVIASCQASCTPFQPQSPLSLSRRSHPLRLSPLSPPSYHLARRRLGVQFFSHLPQVPGPPFHAFEDPTPEPRSPHVCPPTRLGPLSGATTSSGL